MQIEWYYYIIMARQPRIEFPGAFYHVMVRGNQKQAIFHDNRDREKYLELLGNYKNKHGFKIYAYTLMINHVHLLLETPSSPISKIMQVMNLTYTQFFNRKYEKVGHLFQGRYKAKLCDKDEYLLGLLRYIHLNPVRAKIVKKPDEYKWSSHKDYLNNKGGIIEPDRVLRLFSERRTHAQRQYRNFINQWKSEDRDEELYQTVGQQVLGDDRFIEKVERVVTTFNKPLKKPSLERILSAVSETTGITREEIISRSRNNSIMFARHILVGVCREAGYRLVDLQLELRRDMSVLSRWAKAAENREEQRFVQKILKKI
ncbi:MAG TPA: hypothetical protein ENH31_02175 [Nitrospirae bacterium]|nr:chromosomal replication initiator protein DnaA [bacterium BMS3Abin10]GBE40034.1 chromosomal replication initiator protein DnaA [bacterium BMS3Bbin08]HDH51367.1 hypothetical protein [Nitrospirota bacterium]HDK16461.1 hypothetical protein [Nitrospirota bacterium]HDK81357.1 hypothetical protein [Nitrospirota bacterium]